MDITKVAGITEADKFEELFPENQIVILSKDHFNGIIYAENEYRDH